MSGLRLLVVLVCHNRPHCMKDWLRAWKQSDRENAVLYVLNTGNLEAPPLPDDARFLKVSNDGLDIGAVQRFIHSPPEPYDLLMWCPDDFLPMRSDFLRLYREPFVDDSIGMVGTFWGINHVRSGGVCIRREVAEKLRFPPGIQAGGTWDEQRNRCYRFEHGDMNFFNQVKDNGFDVRLANGSTPPSSSDWRNIQEHFILWDRGLPSQHMWRLFDLTFPVIL